MVKEKKIQKEKQTTQPHLAGPVQVRSLAMDTPHYPLPAVVAEVVVKQSARMHLKSCREAIACASHLVDSDAL